MEKTHLLNNQIKAQKVLLLDENGGKVGEMSLNEALERADEKELDLMQVGENKDIAICKILKYDSWLYRENKKKHEQEVKNRSHEMKTMNFRPVTDAHDFELKVKKINEFLEHNHKVKVVIKLRSREGSMKSVNDAMVQRIIDALSEKGGLDSKINSSFKEINFIMKPEKKVVAKAKP